MWREYGHARLTEQMLSTQEESRTWIVASHRRQGNIQSQSTLVEVSREVKNWRLEQLGLQEAHSEKMKEVWRLRKPHIQWTLHVVHSAAYASNEIFVNSFCAASQQFGGRLLPQLSLSSYNKVRTLLCGLHPPIIAAACHIHRLNHPTARETHLVGTYMAVREKEWGSERALEEKGERKRAGVGVLFEWAAKVVLVSTQLNNTDTPARTQVSNSLNLFLLV